MAIGTRIDGEPNLIYKTIEKQKKRADSLEAERVLYVAMTRAREHLVLCGNLGKNNKPNWGDDLFALLGILDCPEKPEERFLMGGLKAQISPISYYTSTSVADLNNPFHSIHQSELRASQIANSILETIGEKKNN